MNRFRKHGLTAFLLFMASLPWMGTPLGAHQSPEQTHAHLTEARPARVLVLFSNRRTLPANQQFLRGLEEALSEAIEYRHLELFEEYLEFHRLALDPDSESSVAFLKERYEETPPDIILSTGTEAKHIAEDFLFEMFPDAVHVFSVLRKDELTASDRDGRAGIVYEANVEPLLDVVSVVLPETRRIFVVAGHAQFDRDVLREVKRRIERSFDYEITESKGGDPEAVKDELANLDPGTVVLYVSFFRDDAGNAYIPRNVAQSLAEVSPVPVFGIYETFFGENVAGVGSVVFSDLGALSGRVVERIAKGESAESIGIVESDDQKLIFNEQVFRRFGMPLGRVPPFAEIRFDEKNLFQTHPIAFSVGLIVIAIQSSLIAALLISIRLGRKADQRALEMKNYFSTVFENSPTPTSVLRSRDGIIYDVNPAWERLHGRSREESIGQTPLDLGIFSAPEDGAIFRDFVLSEQDLSGYEHQARVASGEMIEISFFSRSVKVGDEWLRIVSAVDMRDRRDAEALRSKLNQGNRLAHLGQTSAWIAHEINQPLGAILNNTEAALIYLEKKDASLSELKSIFEDIKSEQARASSVVREVRDSLGTNDTSMEMVELGAWFDGVKRVVQAEAHRRNVQLVFEVEPARGRHLLGARHLLQQVLLNLIFNSMDAVEDFVFSKRIITISACVSSPEDSVLISVRDRGPGIHPSKAESVFEHFYSSKPDGMGVGLAISRTITKDHRGTLEVDTSVDSGACMLWTLPLARKPA